MNLANSKAKLKFLLKSLRGRTTIFLLLFSILVFISIVLWLNSNNVDKTLIGKDVKITRVLQNGEKTPGAYLSIPYTRDSTKYNYANVAIDFNKDGEFAAYKTNGTTQEEWVAQNMSARVFMKEGGSFSFQLFDYEADKRRDFPVVVVLTKRTLSNWNGKEIRSSAILVLQLTKIDTDEISERIELDPKGKGITGSSDLLAKVLYAQSELPDQPLVSDQSEKLAVGERAEAPRKDFLIEFHNGVPDITQGKNECVPTSTANSLLWLREKYNWQDKIPDSEKELISELKKDLQWNIANGVYTDSDFLPGKVAFTKRHNLPLKTHKISEKAYDLNIVEKIYEELKKGQDVEIVFQYFQRKADGTYENKGGHMVTAVGVMKVNNNQFLDIHDPASPGPEALDTYRVDGTRVVDYRYQGRYITFIHSAFAESPIEVKSTPSLQKPEDITSKPSPTSNVLPQQDITRSTTTYTKRPKTFAPYYYYSEDKVSMQLLVIDGKKYPLYQFWLDTDKNECPYTHYNSALMGKPVYTLNYEAKEDPEPLGCGFGEASKLTVEKVVLTIEQASSFVNKVPELQGLRK